MNDELRRIAIAQLKIIEIADEDTCSMIDGITYKMSELFQI